MGSLISKKKKRGRERDVITDQDRAVLDLKNSRDRLKRYQTRVGLTSANNLNIALLLC